MDLADGMVSGAAHSTANTVLPALQLIHAAEGMHRVSGAFVMEKVMKDIFLLIVQLILSLMKRLWLKLVINQHKQLRWLKLILK